MNYLRWTIFHSLLIFLIFVSVKCADPSGTGLNSAACSPINGLNQEIEIETGIEGYEGPVALPVTIVKDIEGFDATTLFFQEAARDQMVVRTTKEGTTTTRAESTIGTIYGYPQDTTTCHTGAAFMNNENIGTLNPLDATCLLGLPVTADMVDQYIALAICGPLNCNTISEPVIVEVADTGVIADTGAANADAYTLQVIITNTSSDSSDPDSLYDISNSRLAFITVDGEEAIAFSATAPADRADDDYVVGAVSPRSGTPVEIATLTTQPSELYDTADGSIVFMGADALLHSVDGLGSVTNIELDNIYFSESSFARDDVLLASPFKLHPSGNVLVYIDQDLNFMLRDLMTGDVIGPIVPSNLDPLDPAAISFDFSMTGDVVAAYHLTDDTYALYSFNPFDAEQNGDVWEAEFTQVIPPLSRRLSSPIVDNFNYVWIQCGIGLCHLDLDVDQPEIEEIIVATDTVYIDRGFNLSRDGRSFITVDLNIEMSARSFNAIGMIPLGTNGEVGNLRILHLGNNPVASRNNPGIIAYNYGVQGTNQVGIANMGRALQLIDAPLSVTPETSYTPLGQLAYIVAHGGYPPYDFSIASGQGLLNTAVGRFQPTESGTATIRVTDQMQHTAEASVFTGAPGTLFNRFGTDGVGKLIDEPNAVATDIRVSQDQKIFTTGYTDDNQLVVAVFDITGELDVEAFDGAGYFTSHIGAPASETRSQVLQLLENGSFLVAGYATPGSNKQFMIANYDLNGLNENFGNEGIVLTDFGINRDDVINDIAITSAGKIIAGGYTNTPAGNDNFALARYTHLGELDVDFGTNGLKTFDIGLGQNDRIENLALQDNQVVAVGRARLGGNNHAIVMKLTTNGVRDSSFGINGVVDLDYGPLDDRAVNVRISDEAIYVLGTTENPVTGHADTFITKLNLSDGSVVTEFGDEGTVTLSRAGADTVGTSLIVGSAKIIIGGYFGDLPETRWMAKRLNLDGQLDTTFGTDGTFLYSEGSAPETVNAMFLGSDGFIYVAGQGVDGANLPLAIGSIWP